MWISCHIYYEKPIEKLLTEAILPCIEELIVSKKIRNSFFIRYYEKGYHIRLRLHFVESIHLEYIKNYVTKELKTYINHYPSKRTDEYSTDLFPNNSFYFTEYEKEINRYGGTKAIVIAEKQFALSSLVVLNILKSTNQWTYQDVITKAIYLNMTFCYSLFGEVESTILFLKFNFKNWLEKVSNFETGDSDVALISMFETDYQNRKNSLVPSLKLLWLALTSGVEFEEAWMNQWALGMAKIREQIYKVHRNNSPLFSIFDSYLHMTNNRLGLMNRDESYISYLVYRSLEEIDGI